MNVILSIDGGFTTSNYISSTNPLLVYISGFSTNTAASATSTTLTFNLANEITSGFNSLQQTTGNFYNVTAIRLSRALPGVNVIIGTVTNSISGTGTNDFNFYQPGTFPNTENVMATLTTGTASNIVYSQSSKTYLGTTSGSTVQYYQPGQTSVPFTMTTVVPVIFSSTNPLTDFFTYTINEINVPSNTASTDSFSFNVVNSTSGVAASPLFQINYSAANTHANVTYTPFTGSGVNAQAGFRSERGSRVVSIASTTLAFNLAKSVDTLSFVVGPYNSSVSSTGKTIGPYGIGQSTSLGNVTVANVSATCSVTGSVTGGSCTVGNVGNLTGVPNVNAAVVPVKLNTASTPLVVLDSNANSASTLVVVGSKFVNTVAQQIFSQNPSLESSFNTGSVVLQAFGSNRILVAGYYANQTVQAGNQFIQALLSATQ